MVIHFFPPSHPSDNSRAESKEVNGSVEDTDQIVKLSRTLYHRREEYVIRLHQEIEDYVTMTKSSNSPKFPLLTFSVIETYYVPRVEAILEKLHAIASSLWQNSHIKIYGSYATSLCIPSSDLDLVVMGASSTMPGKIPYKSTPNSFQVTPYGY
jgi:hypothetical protein